MRIPHHFTANIAFLFPELPFLDRIDAAGRAGFSKVECHFPYDTPVEAIGERLHGAGVELTGLNTAPGDRERGEWGLAALPGREADFARGFDEALGYATALGARVIHVMAGKVEGIDRGAARRAYVANLRAAARQAAGTGVTLVLEPLNPRDVPGYLVSRSDEIAEILGEIGEEGVKLLFDLYHVQITEGDLTRRLERHFPLIGHVQLAAVPSRSEPDEGEVSVRHVLATLERLGYAGLVGLEYRPRGPTAEGLSWIAAAGL